MKILRKTENEKDLKTWFQTHTSTKMSPVSPMSITIINNVM